MAIEVNAHQIEDFALEPACTKPNRDERIHIGMIAGNARAEADLLLLRDGSKVVIHLETRLNGEAVHASGIGQQIKLQRVTTFFGCSPQETMRNDDGSFTVVFDYLFDSLRVPSTQMLDDSVSALV